MSAITETLKHIREVQSLLGMVNRELSRRQDGHDASKLESPEAETFERYTSLLRGTTYGSEEYKAYLAEMRPALEHHYAKNRHHPEHFAYGIKGMNLIDALEMLVDWLAATKRHADGDIRRSIEINQQRFGYSDELKQMLHNTADELDRLQAMEASCR